MPKLTIYVSDELNERIRHASISPSAICQQALDQEVKNVELKTAATTDLDAVVARLQGTANEAANKADDEAREHGRKAGEEWARTTATLAELEEIDRMNQQHWSYWDLEDGNSLCNFAVNDEEGYTGGTVRLIAGDPYAEELLDGALTIYHQIRDRIQ